MLVLLLPVVCWMLLLLPPTAHLSMKVMLLLIMAFCDA
jgi:hypothetical protein